MKIILATREEIEAMSHAVSTAMDNETDKGREGIGEDVLNGLQTACAGLLDWRGDLPFTLSVDLIQGGVIGRYLASLCDDEEHGPAMERLHRALQSAADALAIRTGHGQ